jgi:hypothetical protein
MPTILESLGIDLKHTGDLVKTTGGGDLDTIDGLDNVKAAVLRRIVTRPGEVIHRPTYGVGIANYQSALSSLRTHRELALKIEEQLLQDPRIEAVTSTSIQTDPNDTNMTKIAIRVRIKGYGETSFSFQPFGEVAL